MKLFNKLLLTGAGVFAAGQMIKPRTDKFSKVRRIMQTTFSYKGIYDNVECPENSIPAFESALRNEMGIFTNALLTSDNEVVLIDRESIYTLLGKKVDIEALSLAEVKEFRLMNTDCQVVTLSELFELVAGRVPVYIRIEPYKKHCPSTVLGAVGVEFDRYEGEVIFDTSCESLLRARMMHRPDMIFGKLLMGKKTGGTSSFFRDFIKRNLLTNMVTSPDFISCRYSERTVFGLNLCRNIYGIPVFYWHIRSAEQFDNAVDDGAGVVVSNY